MADVTTLSFTLFGVLTVTFATANPELVGLFIGAMVVIVISYFVCQITITDKYTSEKT